MDNKLPQQIPSPIRVLAKFAESNPSQTLTLLIEDIRLIQSEMEEAVLAYIQRPSQSAHKLDEIKKSTLKIIKSSQEILPLIEKLKKHKYVTY